MMRASAAAQILPQLLHEPIVMAPSVQQYFSNHRVHERLLSDRVRLKAFKKAIHELVKPGDVVMDIGAGTGILSQYAIEAGASTIYLVEENTHILQEAEARLSSYIDQVNLQFIGKRSTNLKTEAIPQKPNVIISETIGSLGVNEGIVDTLRDAKRFLAPNGVFIPNSLSIHCASYFIPTTFLSSQQQYPLSLLRGNLDSKFYTTPTSKELAYFSFGSDCLNSKFCSAVLKYQEPFVHGLCFWFETCLSPKTFLDNSPDTPETSWGVVVLPCFINQKFLEVNFHYNDYDKTNSLLSISLSRIIDHTQDRESVSCSYSQPLTDTKNIVLKFTLESTGLNLKLNKNMG